MLIKPMYDKGFAGPQVQTASQLAGWGPWGVWRAAGLQFTDHSDTGEMPHNLCRSMNSAIKNTHTHMRRGMWLLSPFFPNHRDVWLARCSANFRVIMLLTSHSPPVSCNALHWSPFWSTVFLEHFFKFWTWMPRFSSLLTLKWPMLNVLMV